MNSISPGKECAIQRARWFPAAAQSFATSKKEPGRHKRKLGEFVDA
jgi:hypothetical protein